MLHGKVWLLLTGCRGEDDEPGPVVLDELAHVAGVCSYAISLLLLCRGGRLREAV